MPCLWYKGKVSPKARISRSRRLACRRASLFAAADAPRPPPLPPLPPPSVSVLVAVGAVLPLLGILAVSLLFVWIRVPPLLVLSVSRLIHWRPDSGPSSYTAELVRAPLWSGTHLCGGVAPDRCERLKRPGRHSDSPVRRGHYVLDQRRPYMATKPSLPRSVPVIHRRYIACTAWCWVGFLS